MQPPVATLRGDNRGKLLEVALARAPRPGQVVQLEVTHPGTGASRDLEQAVRFELAAHGRSDPSAISENIFPLDRFFAEGPEGVRAAWGPTPQALVPTEAGRSALDVCMDRLRSATLEAHPRPLSLPEGRWEGLEAILLAVTDEGLLRMYAVCTVADWASDVSGLLQGLEQLQQFMVGELGHAAGPLQVRCRIAG